MKKQALTYADGALVNYPRLVGAAHTFEHDPGLVGQPALRPKSPFDRPNRKGVYTFTDVVWRGHRAIEGKLDNRKHALLVACMDKDFALAAWQYAKGQLGRKINLASVFVAGGAAQENGCRLADLGAIVAYYNGFREFDTIFLAGHLENCGGLAAFSCGGNAVCTHHDFVPNSVQELTFVKRIMEAAQPALIPDGFTGNVQSFVVRNRRRPEVVTLN